MKSAQEGCTSFRRHAAKKAVAIGPPVRAEALLRPEAEPVRLASTDFKTAVIRGATAAAI
ncbi:MAG: hypothetical protein JWR80_2104 [Bradyrhizobium sp.]|nr:hypothetical protein [Bradyrhizobium sp.]